MSGPVRALAREYSGKAIEYDAFWAPVIGPMARPLLPTLPLAGARRVLDVGAGTGAHVNALATAAPHARVVAIDIAEGMLHVTPRRTRQALVAMDVQLLAFQPAVFDVATLIFMLFHVPDPVLALSEVRRVLRPGGTLGVATWGKGDSTPGLSIWREELDRCGAAPDVRDPSVMQHERMDTPDKLTALLVSAGFTSVQVWSQTATHRYDVEQIIRVQVGCGLAARRMANLSPPAAAECEARVRERLRSLPPDAMLHRPEVLFGVARASHE